jgi:hypothetical protein
MANTTFSGPVISTNGFVGNLTGNVTGNVTGNISGTVTGTVVQPVAAVTAAGTKLATADALSNGVNVVGSASGTNGVALPTAVAGTTISVYNSAATNGLIVYANTSDTINVLRSTGGLVIDSVVYATSGAWPTPERPSRTARPCSRGAASR